MLGKGSQKIDIIIIIIMAIMECKSFWREARIVSLSCSENLCLIFVHARRHYISKLMLVRVYLFNILQRGSFVENLDE